MDVFVAEESTVDVFRAAQLRIIQSNDDFSRTLNEKTK
jgi:hypothetical protein